MQQQDSSLSSAVSFCPSFDTYASDKLVDVAARVSREFKAEESSNSVDLLAEQEQEDENYGGDDFEFVSIGKNIDASELFFDGQIRQVFPVFNRDLLLNDGDYCFYDRGNEQTGDATRGCPLEKLFIDVNQAVPSSSSSSSDADEAEEVNNAIFCVWLPRKNPVEPASKCKKSNSTGSSTASSSSSSSLKKWLRFRHLLKRSNSDGKDSFVFLSKPKNNDVKSKEKKTSNEVKSGKAVSPVSAHAAFYAKNRAIKEGDKKRSYLPYKQDLVGLFASNHGLGKSLP